MPSRDSYGLALRGRVGTLSPPSSILFTYYYYAVTANPNEPVPHATSSLCNHCLHQRCPEMLGGAGGVKLFLFNGDISAKTRRPIRSPGLPVWLLAPSPQNRQEEGGGKKIIMRRARNPPRTYNKRRREGRKGRGAGSPRRRGDAARRPARGRAAGGGRSRRRPCPGDSPAVTRGPPQQAALSRVPRFPPLGRARPGSGGGGGEGTERSATGPLTQKMTLKPKMKYLMQQLTSGPL